MNHYKELSQMTLSEINYNQIHLMELEEVYEYINQIISDVAELVMGSVEQDVEYDEEFLAERYFKRYPSKRFKRLLQHRSQLEREYSLGL